LRTLAQGTSSTSTDHAIMILWETKKFSLRDIGSSAVGSLRNKAIEHRPELFDESKNRTISGIFVV